MKLFFKVVASTLLMVCAAIMFYGATLVDFDVPHATFMAWSFTGVGCACIGMGVLSALYLGND